MPVRLFTTQAPGKREKMHGLPNSYGMDRNEKCRITAYARAWNAAHKQKGQHQGPITRTFQQVLQALVFGFANSKTGSCFPSYEALAKRANCSRDSAIEAVKVLEMAGIIRVVSRVKRVGERVLRTSNAYVFRPIGVESEIPTRTVESKDSTFPSKQTEASLTPPVVVLNRQRSILDRALDSFAVATGMNCGTCGARLQSGV